ncbi:MAG: serine/threonine-protein kinase [Deltaproteobacteria bacterium]
MTPERWERVQALFERAVALDEAERATLLDNLDDRDLAREVEALLAADAEGDSLVDGGAADVFGVPPSDLEPGTQVGDYIIEARVGAGAFGVVYRAVHPVIGKLAAVKVLDPMLSRDPHHVSRFVREARAVNEIGHEGIVSAFGFGRTEAGAFYALMDFVAGETLDARLTAQGRFELQDALPILRSLAAALDAAHDAGIVHRDLKPANVMLTPNGPRLLDFGIAKLLDPTRPTDHRTATGQTVGTPAYMAPEQIEGREVDGRTDAYAFGVVIYEMLTGTRPFQATSGAAMMMAHLKETPEPPSRRVDALPAGVDAVVSQLLAKDRTQRPERLVEAVDALTQPVRRRPRRGFMLAVAATAGVGAFLFFATQPREVTPPPPKRAPPVRPAVSILGAPEGAEVFDARSGAKLGVVPGPFEAEVVREVRVVAEGFEPATARLDPRSPAVHVQLERTPEPAPPPKKKRRLHPDLEPM